MPANILFTTDSIHSLKCGVIFCLNYFNHFKRDSFLLMCFFSFIKYLYNNFSGALFCAYYYVMLCLVYRVWMLLEMTSINVSFVVLFMANLNKWCFHTWIYTERCDIRRDFFMLRWSIFTIWWLDLQNVGYVPNSKAVWYWSFGKYMKANT